MRQIWHTNILGATFLTGLHAIATLELVQVADLTDSTQVDACIFVAFAVPMGVFVCLLWKMYMCVSIRVEVLALITSIAQLSPFWSRCVVQI